MDITAKKLSIKVANMDITHWPVDLSCRWGGVGWGECSVIYPATSILLLKYMIIWGKIQLIINPLQLHITTKILNTEILINSIMLFGIWDIVNKDDNNISSLLYKVVRFLSAPKDLPNPWTDMVLLFSEASYKSSEGF